MAIPEIEKQIVEISLKQYCQRRVPENVKNKVRLEYKIRGHSVTLFELRPAFIEPSEWIDIKVAQFRYDSKEKNWALYYADRNSRWHEYFDIEPTKRFEDLLEEVDKDPTGIFWG